MRVTSLTSLLSYSLLILSLYGCYQNKYELEELRLTKQLLANAKSDSKYLLIIPTFGCSGCIETVKEFVINNKHLSRNKFNVVLAVRGIKEQNIIKSDSKWMQIQTIGFLDSNNLINTGIDLDFPCLLYVNDLSIASIEKLDANNLPGKLLDLLK